jgi:hypothetical protein
MKPFSDEQFRAYFLGKLPGAEAENFEEECALSAELTEQSQLVEQELADDYLRGNLSAPDLSLFEANYLITEARRRKLRAAESLWKIAGERPKTLAAASKKSFWQTVFSHPNAFRFAFAGGALLLIFSAAVFYLASLTVDNSDVAAIRETDQPAKLENPAVQNPDDRPVADPNAENPVSKPAPTAPNVQTREADKDLISPPKDLPQIKPLPTPKTARQTAPNFAAFVLFAGTMRDEGEQSIKIAPGVKNLNLLLSPAGEPNNYKLYRAILKTAEGQTVLTVANSRSLNLSLAAEKLENRTYIVFLEGQNANGEYESIAEYTFRVRR